MSSGAFPDLVQRARGGDDVAFESLLEPLIQPAYWLALGLLHDHDAAEDAVQEAAVRAWRKIRNLRQGSDMKPWFFGIVANQCRSAQRSRWWSVLKFAEIDRPASEPDEQIPQGADLRRAMLRLRHSDRLALVLFYYLDLPLDEVAAACGCSRSGARKRLQRSVRRLRPELEIEEMVAI